MSPLKPEADPDFVAALRLAAENDGAAYVERDADQAVRRAFSEYQAAQREREREDFALCLVELRRDLAKRWRNQ